MNINIYKLFMLMLFGVAGMATTIAASPSSGVGITNVEVKEIEEEKIIGASLNTEKLTKRSSKGFAGRFFMAILGVGSFLIGLSYAISRAAKVPFDMVTVSRVSGVTAACYVLLTQGMALMS